MPAFFLLAAASGLVLTPIETPPLLTNPVFSLSTVDATGKTNMNMLTYAIPVGITPRLWAISLYRKSRTHAVWCESQTGILQLLDELHAPLAFTLGGTSAADGSKAPSCEKLGFKWAPAPDGKEQLLPACHAYMRLKQQGPLIDAGEHDVAICVVEGIYKGDAQGRQLSSEILRAKGLVTPQGRAIPPAVAELKDVQTASDAWWRSGAGPRRSGGGPRMSVSMCAPTSVDVSDLGLSLEDLEAPIPWGDGLEASGSESSSAISDDGGCLWRETAEVVSATLTIPGLVGQPSDALGCEFTESTLTVTAWGRTIWSCVLRGELKPEEARWGVAMEGMQPVIELAAPKGGTDRWGGFIKKMGVDSLLQ